MPPGGVFGRPVGPIGAGIHSKHTGALVSCAGAHVGYFVGYFHVPEREDDTACLVDRDLLRVGNCWHERQCRSSGCKREPFHSVPLLPSSIAINHLVSGAINNLSALPCLTSNNQERTVWTEHARRGW